MSELDTGQVSHTAAEIYEEFFVPALFAEWGSRLADAADVKSGDRVLDIACGTGTLARTVAERVGQSGSVVGLDVNEGMLAVAKLRAPHIEWRQGRAEALPFETQRFDAVVSQFGLMFFEDRVKALQEMVRVLRPNHSLAVAVWDALPRSPGYAELVALLQRLFGDEVANALISPFVLGDVATLRALCDEAGLPNAQIVTHIGRARFPSIQQWMYTDIKGWTLADRINDEQFDLLLQEAEKILSPYVQADGSVAFDAPAHIISAKV